LWFLARKARRAGAEAAQGRQELEALAAQNAELSVLLQQTVERLQLLARVHRDMTERELDLEQLLQALARRTCEVLGDAVGIYLPDGDHPPLRAVEAAAPEGLEALRPAFVGWPAPGLPAWVGRAMAAGEALRLSG